MRLPGPSLRRSPKGERPSALILIAPPKFLARLRKQLPQWAKAVVLTEVAKDLTHLTGVDANKIEATCKKGILTVTLPKSTDAQKKEKKIAVAAK
jgi:hypothetical protein